MSLESIEHLVSAIQGVIVVARDVQMLWLDKAGMRQAKKGKSNNSRQPMID